MTLMVGGIVVIVGDGMRQDPGQAESEVGEDVRTQLGVAFPGSVLRVIQDCLDRAFPEPEVSERWL